MSYCLEQRDLLFPIIQKKLSQDYQTQQIIYTYSQFQIIFVMFHENSQRESYQRNLTQMRNKIKRKRSFTCKSELLIKSCDTTSSLLPNQNHQKIHHLQIPMLKTLTKEMMIRKNVQEFIRKLKINSNINKTQAKRKINYFKQIPQRQNQNKKQQFYFYQLQGFSINNVINLSISVFIFFSVIYFHILSSFQSFLQDFREKESRLLWVIASQYICLAGLVLKLLSSLFVQTTYNGYKLTKIYDISKTYLESFQFVWDLVLFISIILLITRNQSVFYGLLAYVVSLIYLGFMQRIDDMVVKILTISKNTKQYISIIRLLLFNFFLAHLFGSILLGVAYLQPDYNWIIRYGIEDNTWVQKYIYSIYWATTIMSTVGFGDIIVTSDFEAVVLVCIMLLGCLILSYNISQVATIYSNFSDFRDELQSDLYMLKRIAHVSKIQKELHQDMAGYLIHSAQLKYQFQQTDLKNIINRLPQQMKQQFLKQSSRSFFSKIPFFNVLKIQTKQNLSERMTVSIAPKQQLLTHRQKGFLNIFILRVGTVGLSCNKKGSSLNNKILDQIIVNVDDSPLLLNPFFLNRSRKINYSMICLTFCGLAQIQYQQFRNCLLQNDSDLQFWRQTYDSDRSLDQEWCTKECSDCLMKHTIFNCPKVHYMPLRSFIYFKKYNSKSKNQQLINHFSDNYKVYKKKYLQYVRARKHRYAKRSPLKYWKSIYVHLQRSLNIKFQRNSKLRRVIKNEDVSKQPKKYKKNNKKNILIIEEQKRFSIDNLFQVDRPYDFEFYFKQYNPKKLVQKDLKSQVEQISVNFFRMASQNQQV